MKRANLLILFILVQYFSYGQGYNTIIDTFYVQTPEYSNSIGLDSLHFPCALTTPDVGSDFPLLILVHGTAAVDKDENTTKDFLDSLGANYRKAQTRIFYEIADSLSRNGIMVLRYDKRSFTLNCIEKPACWYVDTISPYDYISDINSAINFAKTIPYVDTCNIFLAGHSQGGSFVSQVGYQRSDIRGVLNMAGTAQPIDSVAVYQQEFINNDIPGANILREQFDSLRNGFWPMTDTLYMSHFSPRFWLDWISHTDSAVIVQKTSDKPTALMYGTADRFVPASIHFQIWQDSITRPNVTFKLFNNIDHSFGTEFDSTMSPIVLDFMTNWILDNTEPCNGTSIKETHPESKFTIFPNPNQGKINIKSLDENDTPFELITIDGKVLINGIISANSLSQIDVNRFGSGLYFLRIESSVIKIINQ